MQQRNKVGLLRVQDNTSQLHIQKCPLLPAIPQNFQKRKLGKQPIGKTRDRRVRRQIFNNLNMSERNRKLFIFHVFEGKEFSEWSGTETLQKLNNIVYEIKLRIRKELKKIPRQGG